MDDLTHSLDFVHLNNHSRTVVHIDIDCFYAQVEILKNPELSSKPLGIQQKNIVVTSNYIAREYGVKKCMLVTEALKLCPQLLLVNGEDLYDYRQMSSKITQLLQQFSPVVEKLGLDENFVDISQLVSDKMEKGEVGAKEAVGHVYGNSSTDCDCGCSDRLSVGSQIASHMRKDLYDKLNITCCAGVSVNKLLAKLVCSTHKPNQQTILFPGAAMRLMLSLDHLQDIPGIGHRTSELLKTLGIQCVMDLQNGPLPKLNSLLGVEQALRIKKLSFGIDETLVKRSGKPQMIGIEDGFSRISLESDVKTKFNGLLQKLMRLLENDGRIPGAIKVTVRKYDCARKISNRESRQCNVPASCFLPQVGVLYPRTAQKLILFIMQLFDKMVDKTKPFHLTLLGIAFTKFIERGKTCISSFLVKDISVQAVTSFRNPAVYGDEEMDCTVGTQSCSYTEKSGSESEHEPSPKKNKLEHWLTSRKRPLSGKGDSLPNKLLSRAGAVDCGRSSENPALVDMCPAGVDPTVFEELPFDLQKELVESWNNNVPNSGVWCDKIANPKSNTILNYFVPDK